MIESNNKRETALVRRIKAATDPAKQSEFPLDKALVLNAALQPIAEAVDALSERVRQIESHLGIEPPSTASATDFLRDRRKAEKRGLGTNGTAR